jgi:hypothetical protein
LVGDEVGRWRAVRQHGLAACREQSLARAAGVIEGFVAQRIRDLLCDALNENAGVEARFNAMRRRRSLPEFVARAQVQRGFVSMGTDVARLIDSVVSAGRRSRRLLSDSRGRAGLDGLEFLARRGAPIEKGRAGRFRAVEVWRRAAEKKKGRLAFA